MQNYILTLRCPDGPGITHAITGALLAIGANILEQAQFTEPSENLFCNRTRFETEIDDIVRVREAIEAATSHLSPTVTLRNARDPRRILVMVSTQDHCLVDLLYRRQQGELHVEIPVIVSNHPDCAPIAAAHGIPFVHLPVTPETKPAQEQRLRELMTEYRIDAVVLARYMQVLSDELCSELEGRAINIHHSFLPGFKGARPYHQAYARGVKIIGATAHFVSAELDEGPIIEQDVARVTHAQDAEDLAEIGRDVERVVLARAVQLYGADRVMLTGHRTVVFS